MNQAISQPMVVYSLKKVFIFFVVTFVAQHFLFPATKFKKQLSKILADWQNSLNHASLQTKLVIFSRKNVNFHLVPRLK